MTRRVLPPCSVPECEQAAGAVIKGALYCGGHAVERMQRLRDGDGRHGTRMSVGHG